MNKILTVAIPAYNMEKYLHKCLDSLIIDDISLLEEVEVIVINDGSKDSTSKIAHEYQNKYPKIFRVIDKENGNYGSCLNRAFKEAHGLYFKTLDADDWFDKENFQKYIAVLKKNTNLDAIFTPFSYNYVDGRPKNIRTFTGAHFNEITQININDFVQNNWPYGIHSLTVKSDILKEHVEQQTGISYTDIEYCLYSAPYLKKVMYVDVDLYQYSLGRDGQTVAFSSYLKNISNIVLILRRWKDNVEKKNIIIDDKQMYIIKLLFPVFYKISLCYMKRNTEEYAFFRDFDKWLLLVSPTLSSFINSLTIKGFHYVKIWRCLKVDYTKYPLRFLFDYYKSKI